MVCILDSRFRGNDASISGKLAVTTLTRETSVAEVKAMGQPNIQPISFASGSLSLEGELTLLADAKGAAVICHPHPLYGGNMHNNVVLAIEEGMQRAGLSALRFNFRGVGASDGGYESGVGELGDVAAAVDEAVRQTGLEITLAGYSFGAMMVTRAAPELSRVARAVIVAPPLSFGDLGPLASWRQPKFVLVGDRDQYCDSTDLVRALNDLAPPKDHRFLMGCDHFFGGREEDVADAVAKFCRPSS